MFRFLLAFTPPFTGIFLWAGSTASSAAYCQFTNVRNVVSGDCYTEEVAPSESGGVRRGHFVVVGETDGSRVTLRLRGGETWGTAIAQRGGFVMQVPKATGVMEVQYRSASVAEANRVMGIVAQSGAASRTSYDAARSRAADARTLAAYVADYRDAARRYNLRVEEFSRARTDRAQSEIKVDAAKAVLQATRDSVKGEKVDWKRGNLEARASSAEARLQSAQMGVSRVADRIRESVRAAAELRAQMGRDSAYIATHRSR